MRSEGRPKAEQELALVCCCRRRFYYHFRKAQAANPCTEMTGFTRLLASSAGNRDALSDHMPTVTVPQLGHDKTRGFMVINRPWTMQVGLPPTLSRWCRRLRIRLRAAAGDCPYLFLCYHATQLPQGARNRTKQH